MPFCLYFFTHSQVFHKCSLKSPLLNFPQIPHLILSGFLLSSRMETPLCRFTRSLNYSQKIAVPFFCHLCLVTDVRSDPSPLKTTEVIAGWHRGWGPAVVVGPCGEDVMQGGGREWDAGGSPGLQVTASGTTWHEPLWSHWWLGSVTFYDGLRLRAFSLEMKVKSWAWRKWSRALWPLPPALFSACLVCGKL